MNRGTCAGGLPSFLRLGTSWVMAVLFPVLIGCTRPQARMQAEDEGEKDKYKVRALRDVATFYNTEPTPVAGVGLVIDLADTGGDAPAGDYRTMLEKQLAQQDFRNVKEILARKDTSMVLVSGRIPPGAHKGDPIDIDVTLPPGSKTTSLRGGKLLACRLYNYDLARNLAPSRIQNDRAAIGHPIVEAEGRLQVGMGDGEESVRVKQGRIWGGGRCKIDRPLLLVLNEGKQYGAVAKLVADRINQTFHPPMGSMGGEMAHAQNKEYVILKIPPQYRLNLPRFMRVVSLVPLRDSGEGPQKAKGKEENKPSYRQRLEEEVLEPATAVTAALRLESLGDTSRMALRRGLKSEHTLVRFCCAESLAYLGDPSGGKELGQLVAEQPALRAFCLTALASLDEAVSQDALLELLSSPAAETRYGAFRALRALNDREPAIRGELLNESFWLHRVAPGTPGLVHVSTGRRAEIVLFGSDLVLKPPFTLRAGQFNLTAAEEDDQCTIGRFTPLGGAPQHKQCSLQLEDVLRSMTSLGATYPEVVEVLRQTRSCQCLSCPVEADALPQATSVYALKKTGKQISQGGESATGEDEEILSARLELGTTPTLFERGDGGRVRASEASDSPPRKTPAEKKTAARTTFRGSE